MFVSNGSLVTTKTPTGLSPSYYPVTYMPGMAGTWPSAYSAIYAKQLWVYVVVGKRAKATARLPLPVYRRDDLNRPRANDHPMSRLLDRPNPAMSGFDLWLWTSSMFDIFGEAFWLKQREEGRVKALYPLHPAHMSVQEDGWYFDNGTLRLERIARTDLVQFRAFNPESLARGMSPLEPLRATLENEWQARTATSSFWQRGARPGMALMHPATLSDPAAARLKAQMDSMHSGAGQTGSTMLLEEGMKAEPFTLSAEEAQYVETRKLNREEVCAAYDMPPPAVHILDHATFSNITEQFRSVYRDTMAPHLNGFESTIETDLRQAEWPDDDVYAEFLMDGVLRGDFEARQDALSKASHMTIAEKRRMENLPFIEGTDRIFLNAAEVPMAAPQNDDAPAAPPFQNVGLPALVASGVITEQDARELLGIPGTAPGPPAVTEGVQPPVVRSIMGRLSWQKELSEVDHESVLAGVAVRDARIVRGVIERASSVADLRAKVKALGDVKAPRTVETPDVERFRRTGADQLAGFFAQQGPVVLADGWDAHDWDGDLSDVVHALMVAVSSAAGKAALSAAGLSGLYDVARTVDFLRAVAERMAQNINRTTRQAVEAAEPEEQAAVFADATEARSTGVAGAVVATAASFGVIESARHARDAGAVARPTKTWITGPNPRASHASVNGETVDIDETFSNGMEWPGSGDADDIGCNCSVQITYDTGGA